MKKVFTLTLVFVALLVTSCNETKKVSKASSKEIVSGKYEILNVQDATLSSKVFFEVTTSENRVFGKTGCNNFSGNYVIAGNEITFTPFISTKMYCEEHVMKVEDAILKAFSGSRKFNFDNNMFTLVNEDGTVRLKAYRTPKEKK